MMNWLEVQKELNYRLNDFTSNEELLKSYDLQLYNSKLKLEELKQQQALIEQAKVALEQARPLLSQKTISQLEDLANSAIKSIFCIEATVSYDAESKRFVLNSSEGTADLVESNGGGINTVISFVFDLFLLVKSGCRRFMTYDEAFYAVSDQYFQPFMEFVVQSCHDLGVDLLLVSHDQRLTQDIVDTAYVIEDGISRRVK